MQREITPDGSVTASNSFGHSVALSGNIALIGEPHYRGFALTGTGAAFLYDVSTGTQLHRLVANDDPLFTLGQSNAHFGSSVDISGNLVAVGANVNDSNTLTGSAYVFAADTGELLRKFIPEDGTSSDDFGDSIALFGDYLIVGAPRQNSSTGAAYVFDVHTSAQLYKLTPDTTVTGDILGLMFPYMATLPSSLREVTMRTSVMA